MTKAVSMADCCPDEQSAYSECAELSDETSSKLEKSADSSSETAFDLKSRRAHGKGGV